jgi:hypothetical protein
MVLGQWHMDSKVAMQCTAELMDFWPDRYAGQGLKPVLRIRASRSWPGRCLGVCTGMYLPRYLGMYVWIS